MTIKKSLIIKIAFFISVAAFLFSVVTLIRNIVIGAMIPLSVIQLVGAAVIMVICFAMFRAFKNIDDADTEENEGENEEEQAEPEKQPDADDTDSAAPDEAPEEPDRGKSPDDKDSEDEISDILEELSDDDNYNFSLFEES